MNLFHALRTTYAFLGACGWVGWVHRKTPLIRKALRCRANAPRASIIAATTSLCWFGRPDLEQSSEAQARDWELHRRMKPSCLAYLLLRSVVLAATPQQPTRLQTSIEAAALTHPELSRPYQEFRCEAGPERHHVAFNCLTILEKLRREPAEPVTFNQRYWDDEEFGCHITAEAVLRVGSTIVIPDLPNYLIFLLARCFLPHRALPVARSASIRAGERGLYFVRIFPPRGTQGQLGPAESSAIPSLAASNGSATEAAFAPHPPRAGAASVSALGDRAPVRCARVPGEAAGAFTDCLPTLLQILQNPSSGTPVYWKSNVGKRWESPNCRLSMSRVKDGTDIFSEWSLIDDAVWMMGKCFAGPEASRDMNEGSTTVGPLRLWKLKVVWGAVSANGAVNHTFISAAAS